MKDLFKIVDDEIKLEARFQFLISLPYLSSARGEINRIYNSWNGFDKDFAKQFQTTNYEARLWELYLFEFLNSHKFEISKSNQERPDFKIASSTETIYIECVTSNSTNGDRSDLLLNTVNHEDEVDFISRIGSALYSKLSKKYYNLDWVKGKPLVFAIQPYHNSEAFNMNVYSVVKYLYGIEISSKLNESGVKITEFQKVSNKKKLKNGDLVDIESFFDLPNSEHVSGIIFTNSATLGKFTRMGFQNGFDAGETSDIIYSGICHNNDPTDIKPGHFINSIKDKPFDNYNYGVTFFHNPNAKYPIDENFFFCTQCKCLNDEILWKRMNFYPYSGKNFRVVVKRKVSKSSFPKRKTRKKLRKGKPLRIANTKRKRRAKKKIEKRKKR